MYRKILNSTSVRIITVSNFMKDEISDFMKVNTEKIKVVPNGVDIDNSINFTKISKEGMTLVSGKDPQKC